MTYRAMIIRRLKQTAIAIESGERLIAEQRVQLELAQQRGSLVTAQAAKLRHLEEAQAALLATRERLEADLRALDAERDRLSGDKAR